MHTQGHMHTRGHVHMDMHRHVHTRTHAQTHTGTHTRTHKDTRAYTDTHSRAEAGALAPRGPGCFQGTLMQRGIHARPELTPLWSPGPQPSSAPWGADSAGGRSPTTLPAAPKGAWPWPGGGGAGPVGTDLPGPGDRAGMERPRGAASLGLQQRGQRRRRGTGACFTGQESPGWDFRLPQAGPTPTPHLLGGLGWALLPPRAVVGKGSPPQCLRAQPGWWRGSRVPRP